MNINTLIGISKDNEEVRIDFTKHHFMLLIGATGSGKSIFHNHLYRSLSSQNTSDQIGFIFLDMTRVDFGGWNSSYIIKLESNTTKAVEILEELATEKQNEYKHIFIHIEECDMFANLTERTEKAIRDILKNRKDITIIYSTSRPSPNSAVRPSLLSLVDTKVIFKVALQSDQDYILGEELELPVDWGYIISFDSKKIYMRPIDESEFCELVEWKL